MADPSADEVVSASAATKAPVESHAPQTMTALEYAATRFSTLKPPMNNAPNPFKLLAMLSGKQWLFFLVGFFGWVCSLPTLSVAQSLTFHI